MLAPLEHRLIEIAQRSDWMMSALQAARALQLNAWCIGAGAVRDAVWDALYGPATVHRPRDVDLAFFDTTDLSRERDLFLQHRLQQQMPLLPWEVVNQAGVHLWFESEFGHPVPPLTSLADAVASWPETATAIGLTLGEDHRVHVIAPLGLDDLFGGIVRRNPARVSVETYRRRCATKNYRRRWPQLCVLPA
jgi:hypothetical protein